MENFVSSQDSQPKLPDWRSESSPNWRSESSQDDSSQRFPRKSKKRVRFEYEEDEDDDDEEEQESKDEDYIQEEIPKNANFIPTNTFQYEFMEEENSPFTQFEEFLEKEK